ncbi:hypothetical protein GCM10022224_042290 [Nonomuraea antimicrobica]|uniref:AraC family transcriptional regulator n=1 Tax=Nonomuraea antimicrobica TaxID=561173 RepID=A0ABP7C2R5_9ACTN
MRTSSTPERISASAALALGRNRAPAAVSVICRGVASLAVDGRPASGAQPLTTARYLIGWQGMVLGRDALSPVSWDYPRGFPFTGALDRVHIELDDHPETLHETFD